MSPSGRAARQSEAGMAPARWCTPSTGAESVSTGGVRECVESRTGAVGRVGGSSAVKAGRHETRQRHRRSPGLEGAHRAARWRPTLCVCSRVPARISPSLPCPSTLAAMRVLPPPPRSLPTSGGRDDSHHVAQQYWMPFLDLRAGDEMSNALLASRLERFEHAELRGVLLDDDPGQL